MISQRRFCISRRPWYWIFTFWKTKWKIPQYIPLDPGDDGYEDAPLQEMIIFHPKALQTLVRDNPPKK